MTQNVWIHDDDSTAVQAICDNLVRDWRTKVAMTTFDRRTAVAFAKSEKAKDVHLILLDLDTVGKPDEPFQLILRLKKMLPDTPIICTCVTTVTWYLEKAISLPIEGLIHKNDIQYGYAGALALYQSGLWLTTNQIWQAARDYALEAMISTAYVRVVHFRFGDVFQLFTNYKAIQMAACSGQSYEDIADELGLSNTYVRRLVCTAYEDLGLSREKVDWQIVADYIPQSYMLQRLKKRYEEKAHSATAILAFYLLTAPNAYDDHYLN